MKAIGDRGEDLVCRHLESQGYRILAQRWHCRWGEVDVIAQDGSTLRFVEVKTRQDRNWDHGGALALTAAKSAKLLRAIAEFLSAHPHLGDCAYHVDLVLVRRSQGHYSIAEYVPNVLEDSHGLML
jgi:putative endonuclease